MRMPTIFLPGAAVLAFGLGGALLAPALPAAAEAPMSREEVERIVREYLLANPQILNEMIERLQTQENIAAIRQHRAQLDNDGFSFVAGNPLGDVTVVEFFDYNCGFCRKARPETLKLIETDANIRLVLKEFPILGPDSLEVARISMAAQKQEGDYFAFHSRLFSTEGRIDAALAFQVAGELGYDVERLKADMSLPEIDERLGATQAIARDLQIDGTPSFVIGDKVFGGGRSFEELQTLVAEARAKCETC